MTAVLSQLPIVQSIANSSFTVACNEAVIAFWSYMLDQYHPWLVTILFPFLSLILSYVIPCGLMHLLEMADLPFIQKYKIQKNKKNDSKMLMKAVVHLLKSYFLVMWPLYLVAFMFFTHPSIQFLKVSVEELPGIWTMIAQLVFFSVSEDFSHYWIHRLLHTPWLYRNVHHVHHEFTYPSALAASYAHPIEVLMQGMATFSGPMLFRPHVLVLYIWVNVRQLSAIETHSGYDFPLSPNNILYFFGGADLHDYHHRTYNGAFSSNFIWWDVLFGTAKPYFEAKKKQERKLKEKAAVGKKIE